MTLIYKIIFENYEGEYFTEFYHEKTNAYARFYELKLEAENKDEFEFDEETDEISFFDAGYNEYSTFIHLKTDTLENLFMD